MSHSKTVAAVALFLLAASSLASSTTAQKRDKPQKAKPVMCAIVKIDAEYQIVNKAEVADLKKRLTLEHKTALASHKAAKKAAKKNKEKFTDKPPKAPVFKIVKASIEQIKAEAALEKIRENDSKKTPPKKAAPRKSGKATK
ncbi:MAG: hypothetical protein AB8H80_07200 [Planctomycetota bacterium]